MAITRRNFLTRVGQAGGYAAAFASMQSLGLLPMKATAEEMVLAAQGIGKGVRVVVLGGGVAGLASAYEAKKLGYEVIVLEAKPHVGGRNWSARAGDVVEFVDGTKQHVTWSEGLYQNMGAGRLPSVHSNILSYCRELGVPLEVEVNTSRSSFLQSDKVNDGKPFVQRKVINDARGNVSELLSKAVQNGSLDQELSSEDKQRMTEFLKVYGPLDMSGKYKGSDRADIRQYPGAGAKEMIVNDHTIPMHTLLDANFWNGVLFEEAWDWQATMFQPINGMQQISFGFERALGNSVIKNAPVTEIAKTSNGVRITYMKSGRSQQIDADYAICAMPLTILNKTRADLDASHKAAVAVAAPAYRSAFKIAWESRRFWEKDYNLYGGLSFTTQGPSPIWYPSAKMMTERGVVVVGYMDEHDTKFDKLTMEERFARSRASMEKMHPGHGHELEKPIYDAWKQIKWNEGSWVGAISAQTYETLTTPDGPIFFAGDHTSHIVGWQEGAALSGKRAVQMISDRVKSKSA
jgi:monoamine oxidase